MPIIRQATVGPGLLLLLDRHAVYDGFRGHRARHGDSPAGERRRDRPLRVMFLIFLVGTTLEVMADRTRANWRLNRWRSHMAGHTVIIGYGTKGRSAIRTLGQSGVPDDSIVVVDLSAEAVAEANQTGLAAVCGDGTRRSILSQAEVGSAARSSSP